MTSSLSKEIIVNEYKEIYLYTSAKRFLARNFEIFFEASGPPGPALGYRGWFHVETASLGLAQD